MILSLLLAAGVATAQAGEAGLRPPRVSEELLSLHHRAVAHWGMALYETAAREFSQILAAAPDEPALHANLGLMRLSQHRYEEALPSLERAEQLAPDSPRVRLGLGRCLAALDRNEEALAHLRRAAELAPREPAARLRLSEVYFALGRKTEAEAELRRVLELKPGHGSALNRLGRLLEARGRKDEAAPLLARFAALGRRARLAERSRYEAPWEEDAADIKTGRGARWLEVRTTGVRAGTEPVVTVQAGRLTLRREAGDKTARFLLGAKPQADAIRVDWPDGAHTYKIDVPADRSLLIEEISAHVW